MEMQFFDTAPLTGVRVTRDGYLVADARSARCGIQIYSGAALGRPDTESVRVWRPEDEVFHSDAMASMAHRPVTVDHPPQPVDATNWKRLSVGQTGDQIARDGDFIRVPLALMDASAIRAVVDGKRQLSWGYVCALDWTPGVTPGGESYDAVQRSIRCNHLAVVDAARAGPDCRIGDGKDHKPAKGTSEMADVKVTVDGFTFDASEQAAQAISKLQMKADAAEKKAGDLETKIAAADGKHAAEKKTLETKIADLEKKVTDAESAVETRAAERVAVIADAIKIAGKTIETDGKTLDQIRREAVTAALGAEAVKDKADAYIAAAFDVLLDGVGTPDPLRGAIEGAAKVRRTADAADPKTAYDQMCRDMGGAWKGEKTEEKC